MKEQKIIIFLNNVTLTRKSINGLKVMNLLGNKNITLFDTCTKTILFWSYADHEVILLDMFLFSLALRKLIIKTTG